jgi:hypothetical protein
VLSAPGRLEDAAFSRVLLNAMQDIAARVQTNGKITTGFVQLSDRRNFLNIRLSSG